MYIIGNLVWIVNTFVPLLFQATLFIVLEYTDYKMYTANLFLLIYLFTFLGKDFICVQSMDGTVSIFEQESFSFSRFLPGALLPGPLKYIPKLDSFVTASSSWQLECYK